MKPWTTAEIQRIDPSLTIPENAAKLGRTVPSVQHACRKYGRSTRGRGHSDEAIRAARSMRDQGMTVMSISTRLRIPVPTLKHWFQRSRRAGTA